MTRLTAAITSCGMVTGVGLTAPASCAAIRGALDSFQETRFRDSEGGWIIGAEVRMPQPWRGETKLCKMIASAVGECLTSQSPLSLDKVPLLLCLAEPGRPGRCPVDEEEFFHLLETEMGARFHEASRIFSSGRVSVALAIRDALRLLATREVRAVIVAAGDSLLTGPTILHFGDKKRLLTSSNSNGFIPGEAAAALLLEQRRGSDAGHILCRGLGFGVEEAIIGSGTPLRGDGLTDAIKEALADANCNESILSFRAFDGSGEQYGFKEASLAFSRIDRTKRDKFPVWHPADCIGEVGSAIGPVIIAVLKTAFEKGYADGKHVLVHLGNDDGRRCAMIMSASE